MFGDRTQGPQWFQALFFWKFLDVVKQENMDYGFTCGVYEEKLDSS